VWVEAIPKERKEQPESWRLEVLPDVTQGRIIRVKPKASSSALFLQVPGLFGHSLVVLGYVGRAGRPRLVWLAGRKRVLVKSCRHAVLPKRYLRSAARCSFEIIGG
jgi:hypothetical protein